MRLTTFIWTQMEAILSGRERFAVSLGAVTKDMDAARMREHAVADATSSPS